MSTDLPWGLWDSRLNKWLLWRARVRQFPSSAEAERHKQDRVRALKKAKDIMAGYYKKHLVPRQLTAKDVTLHCPLDGAPAIDRKVGKLEKLTQVVHTSPHHRRP